MGRVGPLRLGKTVAEEGVGIHKDSAWNMEQPHVVTWLTADRLASKRVKYI